MARKSLAAHQYRLLVTAVLGLAPAAAPAQYPTSAPSHPAITWPGFATALQNGRYIVVFVDAARRAQLPPAGARLIGCDGEPAERLARERLEGVPRANAAGLLWDTGNPGATRLPTSCTFETAGGRTAYRMEYSPASAALISAAMAAAAAGSRPPLYPRLF
jgi:hypothetical protein